MEKTDRENEFLQDRREERYQELRELKNLYIVGLEDWRRNCQYRLRPVLWGRLERFKSQTAVQLGANDPRPVRPTLPLNIGGPHPRLSMTVEISKVASKSNEEIWRSYFGPPPAAPREQEELMTIQKMQEHVNLFRNQIEVEMFRFVPEFRVWHEGGGDRKDTDLLFAGVKQEEKECRKRAQRVAKQATKNPARQNKAKFAVPMRRLCANKQKR
jgi:hypothetical protein